MTMTMTTRMTSAELTVRPALPADAAAIARVHVASWRETYSRLVPPGALDDLDVGARAERWAQIIADDVTDVWIAERSGEVLGWCSTGPGRGDEAPRDLELEGIYVLAAAHGSGAGQALLDAAIGDAPAFLWSAEDNPRAQAFYRRNGFVDDGTRSEHVLHGHPVRIARFVR